MKYKKIIKNHRLTEFMIIPQKKDLKEKIQTIKSRVEWLYINQPETIESDSVLLDAYESKYNESIRKREDTIKRCGRKLREPHKKCTENFCYAKSSYCFKRSEYKKQIDMENQLIILEGVLSK